MIVQGLYYPSSKELPPPADVEGEVNDADVVGEVTALAVAPSDSASDTIGTAEQVTNFDVTHFRYHDLLLSFN